MDNVNFSLLKAFTFQKKNPIFAVLKFWNTEKRYGKP